MRQHIWVLVASNANFAQASHDPSDVIVAAGGGQPAATAGGTEPFEQRTAAIASGPIASRFSNAVPPLSTS